MKLDFIPLDKLFVGKANMRHGRKAPDVSDLLPTVRARGVLQTLLVRAQGVPGTYEVVAGARRFRAAQIVADERQAAGEAGPPDPLPCAILGEADDGDAVEASLIENLARLDPDEVGQWVTFTRLVREGRTPEEIGRTFGLPDLAVRRVLALGNLLPRIRTLYQRQEIDRATIRHLTMASKSRETEWLALHDDPQAHAPRGAALKAWLLGGQSVSTRFAVFDVAASGLATVADLFGEDRCFAEADAFWTAQHAAIAARREDYLARGWGEVIVVPPTEHFALWEHEKCPKRQGGQVFIDVRGSGEVVIHEGYISRRAAARLARGAAPEAEPVKRPEVTSAMQTYVDLHRRAAVAATLTKHPGIALRLMLAFAIAGAPLWAVRPETLAARDDATRESIAASNAEAAFDERRRAVLALLGCPPDQPYITNAHGADDRQLVAIFLRLLDLPDAAVLDVVAVVMGETLGAGHAAIEAVGLTLGIDMARWWQADPAFFALLRDKQVLTAMVAEVAGAPVAEANAREKGATLKRIVADHLAGAEGRPQVTGWVPRWMRFPPAAYTDRGGVAAVAANARVSEVKAEAVASGQEPVPIAGGDPGGAGARDLPETSGASDAEAMPLAA